MDLYNIHDITKVKTDVNIPLPEYFIEDEMVDKPNIEIIQKKMDFAKRGENQILRGNHFFWREGERLLVDYDLPEDVKLSISGLLGKTKIEISNLFKRFTSRKYWDNMILAIISIKMIQKGNALIHAGALARENKGILVAGLADTGKTSVILSLLDGYEFRFMGDDMIIVSSDGKVFSYPKEVRIAPRTLTGRVLSDEKTLKEKLLEFRPISTVVEKFISEDITKLKRIPDDFVENVCPIEDVFLISGYGDEKARRISRKRMVKQISNLTAQMPNLKDTYLDEYYHLFNLDILSVIRQRARIIKRAINNANCFEVTAPKIGKYLKAIRRVLN